MFPSLVMSKHSTLLPPPSTVSDSQCVVPQCLRLLKACCSQGNVVPGFLEERCGVPCKQVHPIVWITESREVEKSASVLFPGSRRELEGAETETMFTAQGDWLRQPSGRLLNPKKSVGSPPCPPLTLSNPPVGVSDPSLCSSLQEVWLLSSTQMLCRLGSC